MNQIKSVNRVFLGTVLITIAAGLLNNLIYAITGNYLFNLLLSQLLLIVPSGIYLISQKKGLAEAIGFRKIKIGNIVLLIILTFLIMPLMGFINSISMLFVRNDTTEVISEVVGNAGPLFGLVMVALIPCILEESVYRGVFFQSYRKINPLKGIFLSGLLFGVIHQNFNQFSYAFVMGIIFALVIEATDSILSTMIIHFIINGTSVVSIFVYRSMDLIYGTTDGNGLSGTGDITKLTADISPAYIFAVLLPVAALSTLLAFFVFRVLADNSGRWEHVKDIFRSSRQVADTGEEAQRHRFLTPSLIVGIIICLIIMVFNEYISRTAGGAQSEEGFVTVILGLISTIKNFAL